MDHEDIVWLLQKMKVEAYGADTSTTPEDSTSSPETLRTHGSTHPEMNPEMMMSCTFCEDRGKVVFVDGGFVCKSCHTLLERYLDPAAEWRTFLAEDGSKGCDSARCGPPTDDLLPSVGSILSAVGSQRGSIGSRMISRYQLWHQQTYRERNLRITFDLLAVIASRHGLPSVILEAAKSLYKRVSELKITRGDNRRAVIAACIYLACKSNRVPRCMKEISSMFDVKPSCITKATKSFQPVLEMSTVSTSRPSDYVNRFCSNLQASKEFISCCHAIIARASQFDLLAQYTPISAAAGCIAVAAHHLNAEYTRKGIAEACQVSVVTVNKCFKHLRAHIEKLVGCSTSS